MGKTYTVDIKDYDRLLKAFGKQAPKHARKAMIKAAYDGQSEILDVISKMERPPVDLGMYRKGWKVGRRKDGAELENSVPYASVIEEGARPHWAPLQPLIEWVTRKGLMGNKTRSFELIKARTQKLAKAGKVSKTRGGVKAFIQKYRFSASAMRSSWLVVAIMEMAKLIRFKIAKKGQKPRKVMEKAAEKFPEFVKKNVEKELESINIPVAEFPISFVPKE